MAFRKILLLIMPSFMTLVLMIFLLPEGSTPLISNRISFDAKALHLRDSGPAKIDVLAIGSSISLNNINSSTVVKNLKGETFYNASVWNLNFKSILSLLKYYVNEFSPSIVVTVTASVDFNNCYLFPEFDKKVDSLNMLLKGWPEWYFYLKKYNPSRIEARRKMLRLYSNPNHSKSLCFDKWGGVPLNVAEKDKNPVHLKQVMMEMQKKHYKAFESLCTYLRSRKIKFVLALSPTLPHFSGSENATERLKVHKHRIREITEKYGHQFIDLSDLSLYKKEDFADNIHLQKSGAIKLTNMLMKKIRFPSEQ